MDITLSFLGVGHKSIFELQNINANMVLYNVWLILVINMFKFIFNNILNMMLGSMLVVMISAFV
jgi:hypothetical protein